MTATVTTDRPAPKASRPAPSPSVLSEVRWPGATVTYLDPATLDFTGLDDALGPQAAVSDEYAQELLTSLRLCGQIHPIHVWKTGDGELQIVAGRHRARACQLGTLRVRAVVHTTWDAALLLSIRMHENERRKEASAYHTAVQLRHLRNHQGLATYAEVAERAGLSEAQVKAYMSIFRGSDALLDAVREHRVPLSLAAELVRYEQSHGVRAARGMLTRALQGELSVRQLRARRKSSAAVPKAAKLSDKAVQGFVTRLERFAAAEPARASAQLAVLIERATALLTALDAGKKESA